MIKEIYKKAAAAPSMTPSPSPHHSNYVQRKLLKHPTFNATSNSAQGLIVSLKAASFLLPLYGLHYLFIVYRPQIS